ncbi:DUF55-domain-containing protein [Phlebopus sp. FC_14]|nr:DUF55-domain-containing protein [Phlebopus sp. FC_14]
MQSHPTRYWLMKAEPDSRVVKGKDVKFSVDDFESAGTTPWEGVRNFEARNLMREMAVGDKILFYHSNCKNPGIAGFAEVSKEAYPDYTAWDSSHPYFDAKTDKDKPKWFMVDAAFVSRARHFVPLSLLRFIAGLPSSDPPTEIAYVGENGVKAVKAMQLVTRGRLSVQRVTEECWSVIELLAEKGGWESMSFTKTNAAGIRQAKPKAGRKTLTRKIEVDEATADSHKASGLQDEGDAGAEAKQEVTSGRGRKRKASDVHQEQLGDPDQVPRRKSTRTKK